MKRNGLLCFFSVFLLCFSLAGTELSFEKNGSIKIGPATLELRCFSKKWSQPRGDLFRENNGNAFLKVSGRQKLLHEPLHYTATLRKIGDGNYRFRAEIMLEKIQELPFFGVALSLPVNNGPFEVCVDQKPFPIPEAYNGKSVPGVKNNAREVILNLTGGTRLTVKGQFDLSCQDNRRFQNGDSVELRFSGTPGSGMLSRAVIDLELSLRTIKCTPLNIRGIANMGFADDVGDNGKGGWNDQGPQNDLSSFDKTEVQAENARFAIIDPKTNNGKSAVVMGRTVKLYSVTLNLPEGTSGRSLVMLHATCWTPASKLPLGDITVTFADGSSQKFPVSLQDDSGNWHNPTARKNAAVAWKGINPCAQVGLYAAPFNLKRNDPRKIKLELNRHPRHNNVMWMIAGISLADQSFRFTQARKDFYIKAGNGWKPLEFRKGIVAGSPLDFSRFVDAPAGKYGRIISRPDGTLGFSGAPGKRIRIYGTNLCFSANYLTTREVDTLAQTLRQVGFNSIRIHHYDTELLDPNANDSLTFDARKLDQLDYLIATMAKAGIYTTIDLYCNRIFKPGDNIPECKKYGISAMKPLLPVSRAAMENWKAFVKKLLEHRNPYSGKEWRNDPAIWLYNLVNEECLEFCYTHADMKPVYDEKYQRWLKNKGFTASNHRQSQFFNELQSRVLDEQLAYLRDELRVNAMLTSLNHAEFVRLTELRHKFDLVDNHSYHDHPFFSFASWKLPSSQNQLSAIHGMARLPRELLPTRIFGKPFVVTEFNYVSPNMFRAEGGPLMGAYAALQNWDGLYRFAWSHGRGSITNIRPPTTFNECNDPLMQLSDRIILMLFQQGNIRAATEKYAYDIPQNIFATDLPSHFPAEFSELGLIVQIGSVFGSNPVPAGVRRLPASQGADPQALKDARISALWTKAIRSRTAKSSTGEITLDAKNKTFTVKADKVECAILSKGCIGDGFMRIRNASGFQTIAIMALDDRPLRESRRLLCLHLTEISNTEACFANEERTLYRAHGKLPILLRRGTADIEFDTSAQYTVTALKTDGSIAGKLPGSVQNGRFTFTVDTASFPCGVMAVLLERNQK